MSTEPLPKRSAPAEGEDPFVGRRRELAAIGATLDAVASGRGRMEIVSGAPGIGKTRLANEIATIAARRGLRVLRGGCWEGGGAPAYWPWTDLLRGILGEASGDAGAASDFGELVEIAATRAGVPNRGVVDVSKDAQQARFMLFNRFCEFLEATAAAQPILVIVDDGHWADIGSLLLLQFLAGRLADRRIAVLLTSRDPISEMVASTGRHAWTRHRVLHGLSRTEARALLGARAVRTPAPDVLDRLMRLTDGNPYFLKELGHLLIDGEKAAHPTGRVKLPASLLVVTLQQYHRLSLSCRTLLHAAAVVGREFDAELASRAIGMAIRDAVALMDEAVDGRVIAEIDGSRYRFTHALVREAVLDQLHPSDRTRLHESIGVALERQAAAGDRISPAALAHHFCMGLPFTQRRQAATYGIDAGESARRAFAYEEAVFQLRRAQEISGTSLTQVESCDLLLSLGAAEGGAGEWTHSRRTFEDAAALARRINCPARFARAALGFKGMMLGTIPVDFEAVTLLREAEETLGSESLALRAEVYSALSRCLYFSDDQASVNRYSDLAAELAAPLGDDRVNAEIAETRLMAHWRPAELRTVQSCADEMLRLGIRLGDPLLTVRARLYRYWCFLTVGDAQQAAQELGITARLARIPQHPRSRWQILLLRGSQAIAKGRLQFGLRLAARARELGRRVHDSSPAQHGLVQSFQAARLTKDYAGWLTIASQTADRYPNTLGYLAAQALLHAELNQIEESRVVLRDLADRHFEEIPSNNFQLYVLAILAEAVAKCAEPAWASDLYTLLKPHESLHIAPGWGTAIDGSVAHYLGLLARCMHKIDLSISHFEDALKANSALDAPPLYARSKLEYARLLSTLPNQESRLRVQILASSAQRTFAEADLDEYKRQCEAVVAECPSTGASPPAPNALTTYALVRNGDVWTLTYAGHEICIRHRLGFLYIALILRNNGEPIHVLDLISAQPEPSGALADGLNLGPDESTRRGYAERLRSLEQDLAEAEEGHHDLGRIDGLRFEREAITRELAHSYGLSGRPRPLHSPVERARISAKNRISSALAILKPYHDEAHRHLSRSLVTGTYCRYLPDVPRVWRIVVDPKGWT